MGFIGTYLILREIVREVGDHDLVLGWNTVGWRTTLATLTGVRVAGTDLGLLLGLLSLLVGCLAGGLRQRKSVLVSGSLSTFLATGL